MIHLCDKLPDAISRLGYILRVIEMYPFLLESSDRFPLHITIFQGP